MTLDISALQHLADSRLELEDLEGLALDFRVAFGRGEVAASDQSGELPAVQLGDQHPFEPAEQRAEVSRKRIQVAEMSVGDAKPALAATLDRFANRPVGRAPTEHEQLALVVAVLDLLLGHEVGDALDL